MANYETNEKIDMGFINKANILIEALPYIQRLWGKTIVIKYGGNAMKNADLTHKILEDVTLLKYVGINPILVHGGGPEINTMLKRVGVESTANREEGSSGSLRTPSISVRKISFSALSAVATAAAAVSALML